MIRFRKNGELLKLFNRDKKFTIKLIIFHRDLNFTLHKSLLSSTNNHSKNSRHTKLLALEYLIKSLLDNIVISIELITISEKFAADRKTSYLQVS